MNTRLFAGLLLSLSAFTSAARANDAELSYGGTPTLMKGTGTVSMQSELIVMDIGPDGVRVDCRFVFRNNGPATTVRMGFPDEAEHNPDSGEGAPSPALERFKSYVDGVPVKTSLVRGQDNGDSMNFHTKLVSFKRGQTRRVRDVYNVRAGGNIAAGGRGAYGSAFYVLHTGASWRGPIGRSEIIARFRRTKVNKPGQIFQRVQPVSARAIGDKVVQSLSWVKPDREVVVYEGPGQPKAFKNTLTWVRTNWRPTRRDNILLIYKFPA